jgi:hypothetical protein
MPPDAVAIRFFSPKIYSTATIMLVQTGPWLVLRMCVAIWRCGVPMRLENNVGIE